MMRIKHIRAPVVSKLKRKADTDVPTCMNGRPTKRHQIVDDSLIEGFAKLLAQRYLDGLPQEILLNIFQHFAEPWVLTDGLADWEVYMLDRESRIRQQTLISLTKTCRRLNLPATSILYRCAHLPTHRSVLHFLNSLRIQPNLAELVKQISCPHEVLMSLTYALIRPPGDESSSGTALVRRMGCSIGIPRDVDQPFQWYYAYYRIAVHRKVLDWILERAPGIRALSVTCHSPWHRSHPISHLPLEHLSKLSIAMPAQPEAFMRDPSGEYPIVTWLTKSALGQYRALKQLELLHPRGKWIARLVTVEATADPGSNCIEKYVESLTTLRRTGGAFAEWDLLSLQQDIFSPAHFHTLDYAGQSRRCTGACSKIQASGWDINRFLATTGRGTRQLDLDWENDHIQLGQLGPTGTLTSLPMLANLTHLTVSMQVLFQQQFIFYNQLNTILDDPGAELARMFPPSLRVLRISEFMLGVLRPRDPGAEDRSVGSYNGLLFRFVELLRAHWLDARGDRELWFRYCLRLERHPRMAGERSRCMLRWLVSPQRHQDVGRGFARVWRMLPPCAAAVRERGEAR
ncbi:hypothetical protein INS49_008769 [Diaporthe citri]|uniref:uncharacterized protein n=1 Tax=Diaporthe citri TaxID=83186 RepID=UPI001C7E4D72|nr:uncharacterized protein INS49_008769 [Diaporthe citri]KAG6363668.1 hypothetical protein INS49_008769 [Diaporthe citri]